MPLQRETVVHAALKLLDEVGLDGLTMRRLASYLDIQNPSLYWHFTNKQELLNCMAEVIIADAFADLRSPEVDEDWTVWLANFARLLRQMSLAHRDGARMLAEADLTLSNFFGGVELAVRVLQRAGFEGRKAFTGVVIILNYVLGNAFEAQADPSSLSIPGSEKKTSSRRPFIDPERLPTLAALLATEHSFPASSEALFEESLALLIDGLCATLSQKRTEREEN